jgi:hypothetical protein
MPDDGPLDLAGPLPDSRVKPLKQTTTAIPLIIGIADFTWQARDLTFTPTALRSIAALLVYHCMRLLSRDRSVAITS